MRLLQGLFGVVGYPLLRALNTSLISGVVARAMKVSTVIPVRKVMETVDPNEFRPIDLLPLVEKILELVVYDCHLSALNVTVNTE